MRGASQKVSGGQTRSEDHARVAAGLAVLGSDVDLDGPVARDGFEVADGVGRTAASDVVDAEADGVADDAALDPALALVIGLEAAVETLASPVLVVERSTGLVRWASASWLDRFGEQTQVARYLASATDLGESPLPPPGETWQRTRTIVCADGGEDLTDLVLIGGSAGSVDVVTLVAVERSAGTSIVTDRSEVMAIIDGALEGADAASVGVLYVDLDRFKVVHDLVGNLEARRILEVVNRRLGSVVRATDLVFRLASDEFVVLSCELDDAGMAEELGERVRAAVATLPGLGHDLALTASVGVAVSDDAATGEGLLSAAETAVYLAKGRGRNRVAVHDDDLRNRSQRLLTVERQLRRAIEQRDVGFAFQPMVHLASGQVVGAEALLRLGADFGLSAVEVVAAAEHSGLMGTLGSLVLEGIEEQFGEMLRASGDDRVIMCNLSATQLVDDVLREKLLELAADDSIPAGRLALEVPEIVVREQPDAFLALAEQVRPRFKLGMDGFGTTYDSLTQISDLPLDYVKLHRSLTATIGTAKDGRYEIRELVDGLRRAGITVVALGVERQDQANVLAELGCSMAQGFLYAGAVRVEELRELMETGFDTSLPA